MTRDAEEFKARNSETWQSDKDASACSKCYAKFSPILRKHHCRSCGQGAYMCDSMNDCFSSVENK